MEKASRSVPSPCQSRGRIGKVGLWDFLGFIPDPYHPCMAYLPTCTIIYQRNQPNAGIYIYICHPWHGWYSYGGVNWWWVIFVDGFNHQENCTYMTGGGFKYWSYFHLQLGIWSILTTWYVAGWFPTTYVTVCNWYHLSGVHIIFINMGSQTKLSVCHTRGATRIRVCRGKTWWTKLWLLKKLHAASLGSRGW